MLCILCLTLTDIFNNKYSNFIDFFRFFNDVYSDPKKDFYLKSLLKFEVSAFYVDFKSF